MNGTDLDPPTFVKLQHFPAQTMLFAHVKGLSLLCPYALSYATCCCCDCVQQLQRTSAEVNAVLASAAAAAAASSGSAATSTHRTDFGALAVLDSLIANGTEVYINDCATV